MGLLGEAPSLSSLILDSFGVFVDFCEEVF